MLHNIKSFKPTGGNTADFFVSDYHPMSMLQDSHLMPTLQDYHPMSIPQVIGRRYLAALRVCENNSLARSDNECRTLAMSYMLSKTGNSAVSNSAPEDRWEGNCCRRYHLKSRQSLSITTPCTPRNKVLRIILSHDGANVQ